ncbi:MAG: translation initiation factor IF-3, partial [Anaerolineales bacterium]|nr:translation initiation factor IF-3 [Anaerolineales bacterium]
MGKINYWANDRIRAREVRLIGPEGENIGVVPTEEALAIAKEAELDLVEVSPNGNPPVCKVMD